MQIKIRRIVTAALMAALVCVATLIIRIPSPMKGYINLGDGIVLLAGWMLLPQYGFFAAAVGSALADVFAGYVLYAPATFFIKGIMALVAFALAHPMQNAKKRIVFQLLGGVLAELVMVFGYFVFEGVLYGFGASALNLVANFVQAAAGLIVGILLVKLLERAKINLK
jgi:uncharacterized membrane protein